MTQIFDNKLVQFGPEIRDAIRGASAFDAAIGYFNLRGYQQLADLIDEKPANQRYARILVGMSGTEQSETEDGLRIRGLSEDPTLDGYTDAEAARQRRAAVIESFRRQLVLGAPSTRDFETLGALRRHLADGRVVVKLFTQRPLHGKAYIAHTPEVHGKPRTGYVGSSNLTTGGLSRNLELNVDVLDQDATQKLLEWFETLWADRFCIDITEAMLDLIDESWASDRQLTPYELYLKVCFHLSRDAREGTNLYDLPEDLRSYLLSYQEQAVQILARRIHNKGGAMLGDVVGLGKTITAVATAAMLQRAHGYTPLVVCPPNLKRMWDDAFDRYGIHHKVIAYSEAVKQLPELMRCDLVIADESHTMRSSTRQDYQVLHDYIRRNSAHVLLLTATPYNTAFGDVANQLGLYLDDEDDVGFEASAAIAADPRFVDRVGGRVRTFEAFRRSKERSDWTRLMGEHLVRRTRSYIRGTMSDRDDRGDYLTFANGSRFYFPTRIAKPIAHPFLPEDPAAKMTDSDTLDSIQSLRLPRNIAIDYWADDLVLTHAEVELRERLDRAKGNLSGITRTNFYKRLSSCGYSFILSLRRHQARSAVWAHALRNGLSVPIGTPSRNTLDEYTSEDLGIELDEDPESESVASDTWARAYADLKASSDPHLVWARPELFDEQLVSDLEADIEVIRKLLTRYGDWTTGRDSKLQALIRLLTETHPEEKVLIFTEYRDTAEYIGRALTEAGISDTAVVTGHSKNPADLARRFSPRSSSTLHPPASESPEIRVLVATDVLSEGQNLQDSHIVVNYDLPWAIIRLIQRAGRVDRVGQENDEVLVYTLFHESLEPVLNLRQAIRRRLADAAQVFGSDEQIFGDAEEIAIIRDLYSGTLDDLDEDDGEVDAVSRAFEVWHRAEEEDPALARYVSNLPNQALSTRRVRDGGPEGVACFTRTASGLNAFSFGEGTNGAVGAPRSLTDAEALTLFEATPADSTLTRRPDHFDATATLARHSVDRRDPAYGHARGVRGQVLAALKSSPELEVHTVLDQLRQYPLTLTAEGRLRQALRHREPGSLERSLLALAERNELVVAAEPGNDDVYIVCSLGLVAKTA